MKNYEKGNALAQSEDLFQIVGPNKNIHYDIQPQKAAIWKGKPFLSLILLGGILLCCIFSEFIMNHDPTYMDLTHCNLAPNHSFYFGTDTMGRDIFSMIWYGGRISLCIGIIATVISTAIAVVYGTISGNAKGFLDDVMMRFTEILLSIPSLLIIIFVQAMVGAQNVLVISIVIGITSWMSIAKVIRTEVKKLRKSEYVVASRCMGGGFFHVLGVHFAPNFISTIMFMVVMNVRGAIVAESTLSFLGIGLPIEIISWGSMLSLAQNALMTNSWWIILVPGLFLVITLMCITNLGNYVRMEVNQGDGYL